MQHVTDATSESDGVGVTHIGAVDDDHTVIGFDQAIEAAKEGCLSRPALPDERDAFAAGNGERDARECVDAAVHGPIALRNVAGRENHATTTPEPSTIPHLTRSRWRSSLPTR